MILDELRTVIADRKDNPRPDSYTSALFARGKYEILKKVGEEAVEVIVASARSDREQIVHELADLWFHCMVLMHEQGITHDEVLRELEIRSRKRRISDE